MPTVSDLATAHPLGVLAGTKDPANAAPQALVLLQSLMRADAAALVRVDAVGSSYAGWLVSSLGYERAVAQAFAVEFPTTPWMPMVLAAAFALRHGLVSLTLPVPASALAAGLGVHGP